MQIQFGEVKRILPIRLVQHTRGIVGYEEAETRAKIVCRPDLVIHILERDVLAIVWQDTYKKDCVMKPAGTLTGLIQMDLPWFAIALRAGQEQRLSPSLGGTNSGHFPPAPGCPSGVTLPTVLKGST
jgi:hypothetical protein